MLLWMRIATEAMRSIAYYAASMIDRSRRHPDQAERWRAQRRADLLIPVVKAWCTDLGVAVASTGVQVHGGMGYIEETGAAQHMRDARIAPIYEGTNGIQAGDLVGRKLARDRGEAATALFAEIGATLAALEGADGSDFPAIGQALRAGLAALESATAFLVETDAASAAVGSAPYLQLFGIVCAGWLTARQALSANRLLAAGEGDPAFLRAKITTARFYADHFLAQAPGHLPAILGGATVLGFDPDQF
jgi:3-(methylthio)propanoyl-CoA dehydrogenase